MSIFRDGKGKIVGASEDERTRLVSRTPKQTPAASGADDPTRAAAKLEPKTRRIAPGAQSDGGTDDPVVGWIVVVAGPGRGRSLNLGYGLNSIGREPGERASLAFGDEKISRVNHATVTCDPKSCRFYLQHGGGQNLTYVGEDPVLAPIELHGGELISLGDTTVKFVRLCGPDFDWAR